MANMAETQWQN